MNPIALKNGELRAAHVVALGDQAAGVVKALGQQYPVEVAKSGAQPEQIATWLRESVNSGVPTPALPALLIVAKTNDAAEVLKIVEAVAKADYRIRPRVWPAFIDGSPNELKDFDVALTGMTSGACDLVLMLTGARTAEGTAGALSAWLKVKMPAPASVLAELPDSQGRVCRYVALGCTEVVAPPADEAAAADASIDFELVAVETTVRGQLVRQAAASVSGVAAKEAAGALAAAASAGDLQQLLASNQRLTEALIAIERDLPAKLQGCLTELVQTAIEKPAEQSETEELTPVSEQTRNQYLSELAALLSKGGLGKLFVRSRTAALTESITVGAQQDVQRALHAAVESVVDQIPDVVNEVVAAMQLLNDQKRTAALQESVAKRTSTWQRKLRDAATTTAVWPKISTAGITRAWGGPVPSPRTYVVTNSSTVDLLADEDAMVTVIDLRDVAPAVVDLRDSVRQPDLSAMVLLAQYSLPLAAFS